jgi:hypothetical protein
VRLSRRPPPTGRPEPLRRGRPRILHPTVVIPERPDEGHEGRQRDEDRQPQQNRTATIPKGSARGEDEYGASQEDEQAAMVLAARP